MSTRWNWRVEKWTVRRREVFFPLTLFSLHLEDFHSFSALRNIFVHRNSLLWSGSSQVLLQTWGEVESRPMFWLLLITRFSCPSSASLLRHVSILSSFFSTDPCYMLRIGFNFIQYFAMKDQLFCKQGGMFYCSGILSVWSWFRNQKIHWKHASIEMEPKNPWEFFEFIWLLQDS